MNDSSFVFNNRAELESAVKEARERSVAEGSKYFESGDYEKAIDKYKEGGNPNEPAYWSNLAACYEKLGQYDEMENAARSCIRVDANYVYGYYCLANACKAKGDNDGYIAAIKSGLTIQPSNVALKNMKEGLLATREESGSSDDISDSAPNGRDIEEGSNILEILPQQAWVQLQISSK